MKTIPEIADVVEFQTWARNEATTISGLKEDLEAAIAESETETAESIAQKIMDEFQFRQLLLTDSYPFLCDGNKLEIRDPAANLSTYLFCLGLCLLPPAEIENDQRAVQFETVVADAAKKFFGGDVLRIGAPWRNAETPEYCDLLDRVVTLIPNLGEKLMTTAPEGGDAGWDVLVVKNFGDNLFPRFVALGNCATGKTDWKRKGMETQPTLFWSFFAHDHRSVFITFFAVPFAMDEQARLRKLSVSNLTFDRFRICEHAPSIMAEAAEWLGTKRDVALSVSMF
jgi:hypothetical protein